MDKKTTDSLFDRIRKYSGFTQGDKITEEGRYMWVEFCKTGQWHCVFMIRVEPSGVYRVMSSSTVTNQDTMDTLSAYVRGYTFISALRLTQ